MEIHELNPDYTKIECNARPVGHIFYLFKEEYGQDELNKFMEKTGIPLEYFENKNNWVSYEYFCNMLKHLVEYTGDPDIPFKYGIKSSIYSNLWGIVKIIFALVSSPSYTLKTVLALSPGWAQIGKFKILESGKNHAMVEFKIKKDLKQDKNDCLNSQGQFASIPTLWGLPPAQVKEIQCAAEGAESCIYKLSWKNDPLKKKIFFSLMLGIFIVLIFYQILIWGIINQSTINKIIPFLFPIAFYLGGRMFDYKKTLKDNDTVIDEQNKAIIKSLENQQKLNEDLQKKVEERTQEIRLTNLELKKTFLELKKSEEKLIKSEKRISVGYLAAGVAHELNNPLGAIRNYLQDILEEISVHNARRIPLEIAEKATDQCAIIVNDLLSFSREDENLNLAEININDTLEKIITNTKKYFTNFHIKINNYLSPGIPNIVADSMQFNQAITSILINSHNAITGYGQIKITTSYKNKNARIEIIDTGHIISEDEIKTIFDPFQTKKNIKKNFVRKDLGLAISYNIINRLNGDITLESKIETGTIFNIIIPA